MNVSVVVEERVTGQEGSFVEALARPHRDPLVPTLFHEPWWLEAASGGRYEEVTVSAGGRQVGRLPFLLEGKLGWRAAVMPDLTHFLGPAVDEGQGSACSRALRRNQITRELLLQLPRSHHFSQRMHRDVPETLIFEEAGYRSEEEAGYRSEVVFTFEIAPMTEGEIWCGMRDKTRNVIRRADERLTVGEIDPDDFIAMYDHELSRRSRVNHMYRTANARRVCNAALERRRGRLLAARDTQGQTEAAICYVWDDRSAYYLMTTRRQDAHNGAVSLLLWEAIRDCAARGLIFDFDGVGSASSRLFYTGFGGQVRPRFSVTRSRLDYATAFHLYRRVRPGLHGLCGWLTPGAAQLA